MPGQADFSALQLLGDVTSTSPVGTVTNRFLALFTAAPLNDAGTGGTEVSGTGYARVQFCGGVFCTASFTTASTVLTVASTPAWLTALGTPLTPGFGANVYDMSVTGVGAQIGTVQSCVGTTLTLQAPALHASQGAADQLQVSAFPLPVASVGAEPTTVASSITNTAQINFAQAGGAWGTALSWAIYDAVTAGNMRFWDYLGNFPWLPAICNSNATMTVTMPRHGFLVGQAVAVSAKPGGNFPTFLTSNLTNNVGTLLVSAVSTDTIFVQNGGTTVGTSTTGDFMVRGITLQPIPQNITAQFPAGSFVVYAA
jgi:hypothetical protein